MAESETSFRKDAGLRKEVAQIRADTQEIRAGLENMSLQLAYGLRMGPGCQARLGSVRDPSTWGLPHVPSDGFG